MIHVKVSLENGIYKKMVVTGHAGSGDLGFDLVCAGVSSIMTGALNAFDMMDKDVSLHLSQEPLISIELIQANALNLKLFEFVYIQLKTIETSYQEFIEINEKEVA